MMEKFKMIIKELVDKDMPVPEMRQRVVRDANYANKLIDYYEELGISLRDLITLNLKELSFNAIEGLEEKKGTIVEGDDELREIARMMFELNLLRNHFTQEVVDRVMATEPELADEIYEVGQKIKGDNIYI